MSVGAIVLIAITSANWEKRGEGGGEEEGGESKGGRRKEEGGRGKGERGLPLR